MQKSDFKKFYEIWSAACESATGKRPSDNAISFVFENLIDLELTEIYKALQAHSNHPDHCDYWPKAGSIRRAIFGNGDLVSQKAWQKVYHALRCIGHTEDVKFDDHLIMQTIQDLGGWQVLLDASDESIGYKENDFKKTYRAYTNTGLKMPAPEVFRGLENIQRINAGLDLKVFQSYEKKLEISKNVGRDHLKTLPRPIDKAITAGVNDFKAVTADDTLNSIKELLGITVINQKENSEKR